MQPLTSPRLAFTREGSQVQSLCRPPSSPNLFISAAAITVCGENSNPRSMPILRILPEWWFPYGSFAPHSLLMRRRKRTRRGSQGRNYHDSTRDAGPKSPFKDILAEICGIFVGRIADFNFCIRSNDNIYAFVWVSNKLRYYKSSPAIVSRYGWRPACDGHLQIKSWGLGSAL